MATKKRQQNVVWHRSLTSIYLNENGSVIRKGPLEETHFSRIKNIELETPSSCHENCKSLDTIFSITFTLYATNINYSQGEDVGIKRPN